MSTVSPAYTMAEAQAITKSAGFTHTSLGAVFRIDDLCSFSHAISAARGWWSNPDGSPKELNIGERYALMHSELSEGMEGVRTSAQSTKIPGYTNEEEELADLLHRVFDYAKARGLRLGDAFVAKASYNISRQDHSLEARGQEGGKKF